MSNLATSILALTASYLIGSFPTSFVIAKMLRGIDIRQFGSKNVGATNVFRVVGKVPGLIALIVDVLKGVLVTTLVAGSFYSWTKGLDYKFFRAILGFAAICGHIWPVFLKFKGGKGIATTLGVMAVIAPKVFILSGIVWLAIFIVTNYVSLASLGLVLAFPVFSIVMYDSIHLVFITITICVISSYKHKHNIQRLLKGEEKKTYIFKRRV